MTSYLLFPTFEEARIRSAEQARAKGCSFGDGTVFWWAQLENAETAEGALVIEDDGEYGPEGLTPEEEAALVTADQMPPTWFPAPEDA